MSSSSQQQAPKSRVSRDTARRAIDALLKWISARAKQQNRKAQLLDPDDDFLYLVLTLKKVPHKGRTTAYRIPLPHPIFSSASVCLLVDDRPKSPLLPAAARDHVRSLSLPVADVLSLSDLRSSYRPFEARRALADSHDLFLADRRIVPLLPSLLGKHFFKKKKNPVPLDLSRRLWPEQLRKVCLSTLLYFRSGTCSVVRVGRASQDQDEIVDNVMAGIEGVIGYVPKKWARVRSLHVKATESLALPIYQAVPEMGLRIKGLQKKEKEEEGGDEENRIDEVGDEEGNESDESDMEKRIKVVTKTKDDGSKKRKNKVEKTERQNTKRIKKSKVRKETDCGFLKESVTDGFLKGSVTDCLTMQLLG
ncbi:putative ribosomal L1 domain-containing protein 1-like [Cocos nucifera]|uniref:Putative ribosomal L1 domain-containing protein 1-like n=1 Tax=Cocos nucifera TaxID=13894 RepID=A0A8K0MWV2_COCNU|nr:putative ribosomal L1 domain-containing protein 1-like [Cocos nucifera]